MTDALEILTAQHEHLDQLLASARKSGARRAVVAELADYLVAHLAIEQEMFYPALSIRLADSVLAELICEHAEIKRVLADLIWLDDDDDRFAPTLDHLCDLFEGHRAWQDQELFETVAEAMSPVALGALGASVDAGFSILRSTELIAA